MKLSFFLHYYQCPKRDFLSIHFLDSMKGQALREDYVSHEADSHQLSQKLRQILLGYNLLEFI